MVGLAKRLVRTSAGFTLIEIMVAVVILSIGLLGMAAMTIMVIRGNRMAVRQTSATNLAQQLLERLKDVTFSDLGKEDPTCGVPITFGRTNVVCIETDIDAQGQSAGSGPSYNLFLNVCDAGSVAQTKSAGATYCDTSVDFNSDELTCDGNLNAGEKQLLIQVSWLDQGQCHHVNFETVVVDTI